MEENPFNPTSPDPIQFREVLLVDPEITLTTNLDDCDIPLACKILADAGCFNPVSKGIRLRTHSFDLHEGACLAVVIGSSVTLVYRTFEQWDLWEANKRQEEQHQTQQELVCRRMRSSFRTLIDGANHQYTLGHHSKAESLLHLAKSLQDEYSELSGEWSAHSALLNFYSKQADPAAGLTYLDALDCRWQEYHEFAYRFGWRRPDAAFQVFEHALRRFPNECELYKAYALLASGGPARFDLAVNVCERALERNVQDDTKSGFAGRIARIRAKQARLRK